MKTPSRRGNSIILVVGLIVLLLIIAISYITRAQSIRSTAASYRNSAVQDGSVEGVARDIANEIASSLFVRPIEIQTQVGDVLADPIDENIRRTPSSDSPRYGVDPNFAWNYAPWELRAWTNPPDWLTYENKPGLQMELALNGAVPATDNRWFDLTLGTGLQANHAIVLAPRENPRGGPGTGDTRWLRDLEPQRYATDRYLQLADLDPTPGNSFELIDKHADAFSHWRHMTNLARPDNEWRIVRDIADVTGARSGTAGFDASLGLATRGNWSWGNPDSWAASQLDGHHYHGGLIERLDVPVEQWPAQPPTSGGVRLTGVEQTDATLLDSGQSVFTTPEDFWNRWMHWFHPQGYRESLMAAQGFPGQNQGVGPGYPSGDMIPPNFYDLSDLDGDGVDGEYYDPALPGQMGEKPEDEFRKGTARWHVSRALTDTDGDGFTDSFWWLSPHTAPGGLMQVVGVSVTDNAGRLNANVATRAIRNDARNNEGGPPQEGTRGWTPADLALIGQGTPPSEDPWGDESASSTAFLEPNSDPANDTWSVGFFDNRANWSGLFPQRWLTYSDAATEQATPQNQLREAWVGFNPEFFTGSGTLQDLMSELGIEYNKAFPDTDGRDIHDRDNRLFYFQEAGLKPLAAESFFTPLSISDELELRAYEGNNLPWLYGRFEQVINPEWSSSPFNGAIEPAFLRSGQDRQEASPLLEQLGNRQLLADNRRKLTFFSSTRNDVMPPWLWTENRFGRVSLSDTLLRQGILGSGINADSDLRDIDRDGLPDDGFPRFVPHARELIELPPAFVAQSGAWAPDGDTTTPASEPWYRELWDRYHEHMRQKIDLRAYERPAPSRSLMANSDVTDYEPMSLSRRLPMAIFQALTSGELNDSWATRYNDALALGATFQDAGSFAAQTSRDSIMGSGNILEGSSGAMGSGSGGGNNTRYYSGDVHLEQSRQLAASLAANMLAWRDSDLDAPLFPMSWIDGNNQTRGDLGMVPPPRLDGWEVNLNNNDPNYNANYGAWRPVIEDQFIDGTTDVSNVNDPAYYAQAYLSFDPASVTSACCIDGVCTPMTLEDCELFDGLWVPGYNCMEMDCDHVQQYDRGITNVESPYVGDDFDGPGYPRLFASTSGGTLPPLANPWDLGDGDPFVEGGDSNGDGWPDNWLGPARATRNTVRHVGALGMEAQPFITEAFIAHVQRPEQLPVAGASVTTESYTGGYVIPENPPNRFMGAFTGAYPMWVLAGGDGKAINYSGSGIIGAGNGMPNYVRPADTVVVVQISNPYDRPLPLFDRVAVPNSGGNEVYWLPRYAINLFGQVLPLAPATRGSGSTLASISSIMNSNDMDNPITSGLPIDGNTMHGMVLPPATNDRPYTLTIVSMPNARFDKFNPTDVNSAMGNWSNKSSWSLEQNKEGWQWLDFLDVLNTGDGRLDFPPPLTAEGFSHEGQNYTVRPGDLVWVLRPNPQNQAQTDEVWATNRVYYDGDWYGGGNVLVPDSGYEDTAIGGRDTLGDTLMGPADANISVANRLTPRHAGIELIRYHRRDLNGDGDYNDTLGSDGTYPLAFEYGTDLDGNPGNDGPLPDQKVVIDRTLQWNPQRGMMEDPLLRVVTGLEWDRDYTMTTDADSDGMLDAPANKILFGSSLVRERLPQLSASSGWGAPIEFGVGGTEIPGGPLPPGPDPQAFGSGDRFEYNDHGSNTYNWNLIGHNALTQDSWGWFDEYQQAMGLNYQLEDATDRAKANKLAIDNYQKAGETRWVQWARYARPWDIDPDWPYHGPVGDGSVLTPGGPLDQSPPLIHYDGPRYQMDWAAPRYVLGQGQVTKSYGAKWATAAAGLNVNGWGNGGPLVVNEFFPTQQRDFTWTAGENNSNATAALFVEQTVNYTLPRDQWGALAGPNNLTAYVKVLEDNDRYLVNPPPTGVDMTDSNYTTNNHFLEIKGIREVTRLHGDLVHMDLPYIHMAASGGGIGGGGGNATVFDPDGDQFHTVNGLPQSFPWFTRNQRMPRVFQYTPQSVANPQVGYVYRNRKPTAFDNIAAENFEVANPTGYDANSPWSFSDKGVYGLDPMPPFGVPNPTTGPIPTAGQGINGEHPLDEGFLAPFAFQMNQKDRNFEQVGEVLNVFTHSHLISSPWLDGRYPGQPGIAARPDPSVPVQTVRTFSESLARELSDTQAAARPWLARSIWEAQVYNPGGAGLANDWVDKYRASMQDALRRVGRLEVSPGAFARNEIVGEAIQDYPGPTLNLNTNQLSAWIRPNGEVSHIEPEQPAAQRVLDLFVCDGPGIYDIIDNTEYDAGAWALMPDGIVDDEGAYRQLIGRDPRFMNAHGFSGKGTPGLININTASVEVLRALPQMYRLVHGTAGTQVGGGNVLDTNFSGGELANRNPRVAIPEAIVQYRDKSGIIRTMGDGTPTNQAPFQGATNAYLSPIFEPNLDIDRDGEIVPEELAMGTGYTAGPYYGSRGSHTPRNSGDARHRWTRSSLSSMVTGNVPLAFRPMAGDDDFEYDADDDGTPDVDEFNGSDVVYPPDGIAISQGTRGFKGIGELFQLESPASHRVSDYDDLVGQWTDPAAWEIDFAANRPFHLIADQLDGNSTPLQDHRFAFGYPNSPRSVGDIGAPLSTDTSTIRDANGGFHAGAVDIYNFQDILGKIPSWETINVNDGRHRERMLAGDRVAGDAEEANLLFSGISNMITTRSDMFTVHFRVRTFKPHPETGVWDATDPNVIVDDSRYVMLVDRSEVEHPGDQPRIIYIEKIEN